MEQSASQYCLFLLLLLISLTNLFTSAQNVNSTAPLHRRNGVRRTLSRRLVRDPDVVRQIRREERERRQYAPQTGPVRQGAARQQGQDILASTLPQSPSRFAYQNPQTIRGENLNPYRDLRQRQRNKSPFSSIREHSNALSLSHSSAELSRRKSVQNSYQGNAVGRTGQKFRRRLQDRTRLNNGIIRKGHGQKVPKRGGRKNFQPSISKHHQNGSRPVHLSTLSSSIAYLADVYRDKSQVSQINGIKTLAPNKVKAEEYNLPETDDRSVEKQGERPVDGDNLQLLLPDDVVNSEEDDHDIVPTQETRQILEEAGQVLKVKNETHSGQTSGPLFANSQADGSLLKTQSPSQQPQQKKNGELTDLNQTRTYSSQITMRSPNSVSAFTPAQRPHRAYWQQQIPYSRRSITNRGPTDRIGYGLRSILPDCDPRTCLPPSCLCPSYSHPASFPVHKVPMIVMLTFDDAITSWNFPFFQKIMSQGFRNPNGCPIKMTFFVCDDGNNDYTLTGRLHTLGHEIASHSQTHQFPEGWWSHSATKSDYVREFVGQRRKFWRLAGIPISKVKGLRAPFLSINGNNMMDMAKKYRFLYDSSCVANDHIGYGSRPVWPYTLDHPPNSVICEQETRPTQSFPGVWEVPLAKYSCNDRIESSKGKWMLDECKGRIGNTSDDVANFFWRHFSHHYPTHAPMGLFTHATYFRDEPEAMSGLLAFLHGLTAMEDVWLVSVSQMLDWMKSPTPTDQLSSLQSWSCT